METTNKIRRTCLRLALVALFVISGLLPSQAAQADGPVIYVDQDAPGPTHDGTSWDNAYLYLTDAIAAASTGNQIWVAEGVYYPDEGAGRTDDNTDHSFAMKSGVQIYGGFSGTEALLSQRDWQANPTILSGDIAQDDENLDGNFITELWSQQAGANSKSVVVASSVDAAARLDGFIVTAGNNTSEGWGIGGGIKNLYTSPGYYNLELRGNKANNYGGGMGNQSSSPWVENVLFDGNYVTNALGATGAGMGNLYSDSQPKLINCVFNNNRSDAYGGALGTVSGGGTYQNVSFTNNSAAFYGGAVSFWDGGTINFRDVTIENNKAEKGGGIYALRSGVVNLENVSFISNEAINTEAGNDGAGLMASSGITVNANNVQFVGNYAGDNGGGLAMDGGVLNLTNGLFLGNRAWLGRGGGLWVDQNLNASITNVTFNGNKALLYTSGSGDLPWGGAISSGFFYEGQTTVTNSILWGNYPNEINAQTGADKIYVAYSNVNQAGGFTDSGHNINADPQFVAPADHNLAPTTVGNLRLEHTSPAIDAGDNTPVTLTTDLDGSPRFIDAITTPDTGNGIPPIVDMGAYESLGYAPDLTAVKVNDAGGSAALGAPFNWTITVSNSGVSPAEFAGDELILVDDLPADGVTYGAPLAATEEITGTISCTVDSNPSLLCTASGVVVMGPDTQWSVTLPATSSSFGSLVNPSSAGACAVDPTGSVAEIYEDNNACADSLTVGVPVMTGEIHNAAHEPVSAAPAGTIVHGHAAVDGPAGSPTPTGEVTLGLYDDALCSGAPVASETLALAGGSVEFSPWTAVSTYYRYSYGGDSAHTSLTGECLFFSTYQSGPTFIVNTTADDALDSGCSEAHCTLREAIVAANETAGDNTILFVVGEAKTITLTSALPPISAITGAFVIDGEGHALTISGASLYRVFKVASNAQVTLANLAVADGRHTGSECGSLSCGGGLKVETGADVTLDHVVMTNNSATHLGGGIYSEGNLTIRDSSITGNSGSEGGGVFNLGTLLIENSALTGNTASGWGGAIYNEGTLTITNSTLAANAANGTTGLSGGGAVNQFGSASSAHLSHVTVADNTASNQPGRAGLWIEQGSLSLHNSLLAGNGAGNCNLTGAAAINADTLSTDATCAGATQVADAGLGALTGSPSYYPLLYNSPAIDAGTTTGCPEADIRGELRNDWNCDAGAFELKLADSAVVQRPVTGGEVTFGPTLVKMDFDDVGELASAVVEYNAGPYTSTLGTDVEAGVGWGPYYALSGQSASGAPVTGGFTQTLTLPHSGLSLPKVCRYVALDDYGWECRMTGSSGSFVWRVGLNTFSDRVSSNTLHVTAGAGNSAPVGKHLVVTTGEDTPYTGVLAATDADGDSFTFAKAGNPTHGSVSVDASGTFTYTPSADYNGPDSFTFSVSDGKGDGNEGVVTITVAPVNDPPVASDQPVTTDEDAPYSGFLTASDPDGDSLTYARVTNPTHGSVSVDASGAFTYTPSADYYGSDSFTFSAADGHGGTDTARVNITVAPVNDAPVADGQSVTTSEDTPYTGVLTASDVEGDSFTIAKAGDPSHGSVSVDASGTFTYTPSADYNGPDSFTFSVTDEHEAASTAQVDITVTAVNDAPVANGQSVTAYEDALYLGTLTASDVDGDSLTYARVTNPEHGSVSVDASGTFTYTPSAEYSGPDSFTFSVSDGHGGTVTAQVDIFVTAVNDAPVAVALTLTIDEDTPYNGELTASDAEGHSLTYALEGYPEHGSVSVDASGTFTYTPSADYNGPDSFIFSVTDEQGAIGGAYVEITITPVNDAPVGDAQSVTTDEDTPYSGVLTASDVEGDSFTFAKAGDPSHGSVSVDASGAFTYTPSADYNGPDSFTFSVTDEHGATGTAQINITVSPVNDTLIVDAGPDQVVVEGSAVSFSGSFNDLASSLHADETITWDFGDGSGASGVLTPTHTFADDGVFTVTLAVTGTLGDVGQDILLVTVINGDPVLGTLADQNANTEVPFNIQITYSDPGILDTHTATIDWGDSTAMTSGIVDPAGSTVSGSHIYMEPGAYTLTINLTDDDGGQASVEAVVVVTQTVYYRLYLPVIVQQQGH